MARRYWWKVAALALACMVAHVQAQTPNPLSCRPTVASGPGGGGPNRTPASPTTQTVSCGSMTISLATSPASAPASAPPLPDKRASETSAVPDPNAKILQWGMYGAGVLAALAIVLMIFAVCISHTRNGIAVNRDDIRFGGSGRGWEMSPALATFVGSAILAVLAVLLATQVIGSSRSGASTTSEAKSKAG
jgi:disulfide bond formation protein DsbB